MRKDTTAIYPTRERTMTGTVQIAPEITRAL